MCWIISATQYNKWENGTWKDDRNHPIYILAVGVPLVTLHQRKRGVWYRNK